jgi:hypothetical protein
LRLQHPQQHTTLNEMRWICIDVQKKNCVILPRWGSTGQQRKGDILHGHYALTSK